ncbi:hypothetical protein [Niabella hibiscisoli]|uniref:hypothetical protein n=1 Tax=Niabella hibiscisoli TaxID=1825928 RepID=UPI001F0DED8E|nr:hypothetical protein [Niabella hibiscisoli]MCH5719205.1 hypothetical protein [Niabella hibiscisoli]
MKQLLLYLLLVTLCYSCKKEVSKYEDGSDPTGTVWVTNEKVGMISETIRFITSSKVEIESIYNDRRKVTTAGTYYFENVSRVYFILPSETRRYIIGPKVIQQTDDRTGFLYWKQ